MLELHSADVWAYLRRLAKGRGAILAAVAYVTDDEVIRFAEGDVLVTDASNAAIRNGETSARVLDRALRRKASLFSVPNLHAKVICTDGLAVIGSANLSRSSLRTLHEAAVVTDRPDLVASVVRLVNQLSRNADVIDRDFVDRALAIPVERRPFRGTRRKRQAVHVNKGRTWLIGLSNDVDYPGDEDAVERVNEAVAATAAHPDYVGWFWWPGARSRFVKLAHVGDSVVAIVRRKERDRTARGVRVYRHAPIMKVFRERGSNVWTYHYADPVNAERTSQTWGDFLRLAKRAGMSPPSIRSARELTAKQSAALHELWPT